MKVDLSHVIDNRALDCFILAFEKLLADMDAAYIKIAANYQFCCKGCEDNCCRSTFHHHTLLEYVYLSRGLSGLPKDLQNHILTKARRLVKEDHKKKRMCPANEDQSCLLYAYRPMICRLHGIPYTLAGAGSIRNGSGCHIFENLNSNRITTRLDRTPIYQRMAWLEKKLRQLVSFKGRMHLTVAEMLLCFGLDNVGSSTKSQISMTTDHLR